MGLGQVLLQRAAPRQRLAPAACFCCDMGSACLPAAAHHCATLCCSHSPLVGAASMRASKAFSRSSMLLLGASCWCPYFATSAGTQAQVHRVTSTCHHHVRSNTATSGAAIGASPAACMMSSTTEGQGPYHLQRLAALAAAWTMLHIPLPACPVNIHCQSPPQGR